MGSPWTVSGAVARVFLSSKIARVYRSVNLPVLKRVECPMLDATRVVRPERSRQHRSLANLRAMPADLHGRDLGHQWSQIAPMK